MTQQLWQTLIGKTVDALLETESWKATTFVSAKQVVRATRKMYGRNTPRGRRIDKRDRSIDIALAIGRPNFSEAKLLKKYSDPKFPFRTYKLPPKRRA